MGPFQQVPKHHTARLHKKVIAKNNPLVPQIIEYRTYTLCGTPEYIAPEVLLNKGHGKPVDWWTLGILIYEMVVGYPPFVDDDPMGIYQKILAGKIVFPKFFDKTGRTLVKKLLTADLGRRCFHDGAVCWECCWSCQPCFHH